MEDYDKNEQTRLTLAISFIATYLTIIVGFGDKISIKHTGDFNIVFYAMFIVNGILISLSFFLYLCFTALKLTFDQKKEIIFKQEISPIKLQITRKRLFNTGVKLIFSSFLYPIYYTYIFLEQKLGIAKALIFFILFLLIIYTIIWALFDDHKKSNLRP